MKIQTLCHYRSSTVISTDIKVVVGNILRIICMRGTCVNVFSTVLTQPFDFQCPLK